MLIKLGSTWKNSGLKVKQNTKGWLSPERQYTRMGGEWHRTYLDSDTVMETFEQGNIFTLGSLSATRQRDSAFTGGWGLRTNATNEGFRTKLSNNVLTDLGGTYRYETLVRPVSAAYDGSLVGIAFCGASADPQDVYVALIDTRNNDTGKDSLSELGLQLRYGTGWSDILGGVSQPIEMGQWYRLVVKHNQVTGHIVVYVEDVQGTVLARLSRTDTRLKGGRFGVFTVGGADFDQVSRERIA